MGFAFCAFPALVVKVACGVEEPARKVLINPPERTTPPVEKNCPPAPNGPGARKTVAATLFHSAQLFRLVNGRLIGKAGEWFEWVFLRLSMRDQVGNVVPILDE